MGRGKSITIQQRADAFKDDKFFVSDSGVLMCGICNVRLDWQKKDTLNKHVIGAGHVKKKEDFLKSTAEGRAPKRQSTIPLLAEKAKKAKVEKVTFIDETVKMCLKANIPINKMDHPAVREYFQKYIPGSGDLPTADTLRRDYMQPIGEEMKEDLREAIKDKPIVVIVDETSDCKGRCVLAVLFRTMTPTATQDVFLASCMFLDNATGSTCCQAINETLTSYGVEYHNVLGIVSDSARYMTACYNAMNTLLGEHLLHYQCFAHKVNLVGEIFMKELTELNLFVVKTKMAFLNARKMKSAYITFLQDEYPTLPPVLFPNPVVTRWNSWFQSVIYLAKYVDALIDFINQYESRNASAEYLLEQFADPKSKRALELQMKFVAESCEKFVTLINKLEGSKYPYAHLLWDDLEQLGALLKRLADGHFQQQTNACLLSITSVVERESLKNLLRQCAQKSGCKLATHMAPGVTNNFYKAAGQLFNPAVAAQSLTPKEATVKSCLPQLPAFTGVEEDDFVEGYLHFHKQLTNLVRDDHKIDLIQILMALKVTNPSFATPALQTIWAPVNSVDAERFFSHYNLILTDRRTRMKTTTIETCAMLSFNQ